MRSRQVAGRHLTLEYGLIVDVETTGLDPQKDEIIEVGAILFNMPSPGKANIVEMMGALRQPSQPLSPEISKLTGLSDEDLAGQSIDWQRVGELFAKAEIIVAHNARFDRSFLSRMPELDAASRHWACSQRHIDWRGHGFSSQALNYLACDHGFINPFAHRALFDCATTFRLIQPYLAELIDTSFKKFVRIDAIGAPYESKDVLRQTGYRWDAANRHWSKIVIETALDGERLFLSQSVYQGQPRHRESPMNLWEADA